MTTQVLLPQYLILLILAHPMPLPGSISCLRRENTTKRMNPQKIRSSHKLQELAYITADVDGAIYRPLILHGISTSAIGIYT
jgi:hypothetical protein